MRLRRRKYQIVACLLVIITVGLLIPSGIAQEEKLGLLRIAKAEYPPQVPRSYSFSIKLEVEYAFHDYFEIHAAIYEGARGALSNPLWEGSTERLIEVGQKTYDVQLKSPSREGQWILTGYVFFREGSGSDYLTDQERGPGFVEMCIKVADNAKLTLRTPYRNIPVSVDGSQYSTDASGFLVREVKVMTEHKTAAPESVSIAEGWRAIFRSWNGTDPSNPKIFMVTGDLLLTIDFQDQFYLDLVSNVADVRGAGWYRAGVVANFTAPSVVPSKGWEGILGVQWRFVGWSGDVVSVSPSESVVMDGQHRVLANWTLDYEGLFYLVIVTAALAAAGAALFLGRRMARRRSDEASDEQVAPSVRTFCAFCGSSIEPDARFCSKCGRSQLNSG